MQTKQAQSKSLAADWFQNLTKPPETRMNKPIMSNCNLDKECAFDHIYVIFTFYPTDYLEFVIFLVT